MKYIRNREQFSKLNENIFKKLFKSVKSKLALSLSKSLGGSAKKVDTLMDKYKQQLTSLLDEKNQKLKAVVELEMSKQEGGDVENELKKAIANNKKSDALYDQKKAKLKERFDLEFNKVVKEDENEDVNHYIKIKKIEMGEEMIQYEMKYIEEDMGIDGDKIESSEMLRNLVDGKKKQLAKVTQMKEDIEKEGLAKAKTEDEAAAPKVGDTVTYNSKADSDGDGEYTGDEVTGEVMDKEPNTKGNIVIKTENTPSGVEIKPEQIKPDKTRRKRRK